ncbi:MAG: HU family DNA-binding protein [Bacteroidota bacterium]
MTTTTLDQLKETLADVVREALANGQDVQLPGLGTLRVVHKPSEMIEDDNGQIVMRPPRDEVVFEPENA